MDSFGFAQYRFWIANLGLGEKNKCTGNFESSLAFLVPAIENPKSKVENGWGSSLSLSHSDSGAVAQAQQPKAYRIGVLLPGEQWHEIVDGLRVGLRELGIEEGKQFVLSIRDWKGDAKMAEEAARKFEQEKVSLIYTTSTNSTVAARRATAEIFIVFCAGTDPVVVRARG